MVAKSIDTDVLNNVYPALGDRFKENFVEAITLFIHGCETGSNEELQHSKVLNDEWADWYVPRRKSIEDAANAASPTDCSFLVADYSHACMASCARYTIPARLGATEFSAVPVLYQKPGIISYSAPRPNSGGASVDEYSDRQRR